MVSEIERPNTDQIPSENFTSRYGLAQPRPEDFVRVNDLNWNFQELDKKALKRNGDNDTFWKDEITKTEQVVIEPSGTFLKFKYHNGGFVMGSEGEHSSGLGFYLGQNQAMWFCGSNDYKFYDSCIYSNTAPGFAYYGSSSSPPTSMGSGLNLGKNYLAIDPESDSTYATVVLGKTKLRAVNNELRVESFDSLLNPELWDSNCIQTSLSSTSFGLDTGGWNKEVSIILSKFRLRFIPSGEAIDGVNPGDDGYMGGALVIERNVGGVWVQKQRFI